MDIEKMNHAEVPRRIQRKRTRGWKMPQNTVYVGRPTKWGNPFSVGDYGREQAVEMFRGYIGHPNSPLEFEPDDIYELRGKNLACWCREGEVCHADVLLELANS
jgi:hypothetical protein